MRDRDQVAPPSIRRARAEETDAIAELFTESVHTLAANDYSSEQLSAWAPRPPDFDWWRERLGGRAIVYVAVSAEQIVGFASVLPDGDLDLLYTRAGFVRRGIATALLRRVEVETCSRGLSSLVANVSKTARPFFEWAGFRLIRLQTVERRGVELVNYRMEKRL